MKLSKIIQNIIVLLAFFYSAMPIQARAQSESGDLFVQGVITDSAPNSAPTITDPQGGQTVHEKAFAVKGSCIAGLVIKIFDNSTFSGSSICSDSNHYSILVDLFEDSNDLTAIQYSINDQASPASDLIRVFFIPPQSEPALPPSQQPTIARFNLRISFEPTRTIFMGQGFALPIHFNGGQGPYAVSIDWGDGESSLFSRSNADDFIGRHIYESAGYKTATIKVTDSLGEKATLQFVLTVNGDVLSLPILESLKPIASALNLTPSITLGLGGVVVGMPLGIMLAMFFARFFIK